MTECLCMYSAQWVLRKRRWRHFRVKLIQISTKCDSFFHTYNQSSCLGWLIFNYFSVSLVWRILSWLIRYKKLLHYRFQIYFILFLPFSHTYTFEANIFTNWTIGRKKMIPFWLWERIKICVLTNCHVDFFVKIQISTCFYDQKCNILFWQIIKPKNSYIWRTFYSIHVHYVEVFFTARTENRVHCSELGGVHYIEVFLQQKSIGGTETCVQIGGVHYIEVFTDGGFTVFVFLLFSIESVPKKE